MKISFSRLKFLILFPIISLLGATSVFAATSLFSENPLDNAIALISNLFIIRSLTDNPVVQEGFLKFILFITMFAVLNSLLRRAEGIFDARTAGIVSFAISMIGIFLMPRQWFDATGSTVVALSTSLFFILIFWGGAYYAMTNFNEGAGRRFVGFLMLLVLLLLLSWWGKIVGFSSLILLIKEDWIKKWT